MNADKNPSPSAVSVDDSMVRGGPFYRVQRAIGLIGANQWNLTRRIVVLLAISWLPLLLITAITNPDALLSLLKDYRVHSRSLIAIPVLLVGEILMDSRFRTVFAHLRKARQIRHLHTRRSNLSKLFKSVQRADSTRTSVSPTGSG